MEVDCACCKTKFKSAGYTTITHAKYFKELFPESTTGQVCPMCYDKCRAHIARVNQVKCACCGNVLGAKQLLYSSLEVAYKTLFPNSPLSDSGKTCANCYVKARSYLKKQEKQKPASSKQKTDGDGGHSSSGDSSSSSSETSKRNSDAESKLLKKKKKKRRKKTSPKKRSDDTSSPNSNRNGSTAVSEPKNRKKLILYAKSGSSTTAKSSINSNNNSSEMNSATVGTKRKNHDDSAERLSSSPPSKKVRTSEETDQKPVIANVNNDIDQDNDIDFSISKKRSIDTTCACCASQLEKKQKPYEKHQSIYKQLFPDSPVGGSRTVCSNCYMKAYFESRQFTTVNYDDDSDLESDYDTEESDVDMNNNADNVNNNNNNTNHSNNNSNNNHLTTSGNHLSTFQNSGDVTEDSSTDLSDFSNTPVKKDVVQDYPLPTQDSSMVNEKSTPNRTAPLVCVCCNETIGSKSRFMLNTGQNGYAPYYRELYPHAKEGYVCQSCYENCREHVAKKQGLKCACCASNLTRKQYKYSDSYKGVFTESPVTDSGKVCQNCYLKMARHKKQGKLNNIKESKGSETDDSDTESRTVTKKKISLAKVSPEKHKQHDPPNTCCCCYQDMGSRTGALYSTYAEFYTELFPSSKPGRVCYTCYQKCKKFKAEKENIKCCCCQGTLGQQQLSYDTQKDVYKILFPNSPLNDSLKVCGNCYVKAKKLKAKMEKNGEQIPVTPKSVSPNKTTDSASDMDQIEVKMESAAPQSVQATSKTPDPVNSLTVFLDFRLLKPGFNILFRDGTIPNDMYDSVSTVRMMLRDASYTGDDLSDELQPYAMKELSTIGAEIVSVRRVDKDAQGLEIQESIRNSEEYRPVSKDRFIVYVRIKTPSQ